jgi:hypothetical protein
MKSQEIEDDEFNDVNAGEQRHLLEAGIYPARWVSNTKRGTPWGEKLVFTWEVFRSTRFRDPTMRDTFVLLQGYYNVNRDKSKRPIFGDGHAYRKDWIAANNGKHPQRRSSLPLTVFRDRFLWVEVTTVTKDARGQAHRSSHYSKVQRVIGPVHEDDVVERLPLQLVDIG